MLELSLMNSGHNGALELEIQENRFLTPYEEYHLRQRMARSDQPRHQPAFISRLLRDLRSISIVQEREVEIRDI